MPPGPQVGSAHIKIEADGAQARSELDKTGGSLDRFGQKIEDKTQGVRKLTGALGSTAGVLTGLLGVLATVTLAVKGLTLAWAALTKESKTMRDEAEKLNKEFNLMGLLAKNAGDFSESFGFRQASERAAELQDELDKLNAKVATAPRAQRDNARRDRDAVAEDLRVQTDLVAGFVERQKKLEADALAEKTRIEDEARAKKLAKDIAAADELLRKTKENIEKEFQDRLERTIDFFRDQNERREKAAAARLQAEQDFIAASAALAQRGANSSIEQIGVTMETLPALIQQSGQRRRYSA